MSAPALSQSSPAARCYEAFAATGDCEAALIAGYRAEGLLDINGVGSGMSPRLWDRRSDMVNAERSAVALKNDRKVLRFLSKEPTRWHSLADITNTLIMSKTTVRRIVDRLRQRGAVAKRKSPDTTQKTFEFRVVVADASND